VNPNLVGIGAVTPDPACPYEATLASQVRTWQWLTLALFVTGSVVGYYVGRGH
jgi:Ni,Fe-hydrogenase I cytochrome b subunit